MGEDGLTAPPAPTTAAAVFGPALDRVVRYADLLASAGVERGLLGPREVPRLWERHLLNCAAVADLVPPAASVVDLGSGAGLPGLVLALQRPDAAVTLLEPLLRRAVFLAECVERLSLRNVEVVRERAENWGGRPRVDVVTARAVAPLDRLAGWGLPLVRPGGVLLAIKGDSAAEELAAAEQQLRQRGGREWSVLRIGLAEEVPPTTVVRVVRTDADPPTGTGGTARRVPERPAAARRSGRGGVSRGRSFRGGRRGGTGPAS